MACFFRNKAVFLSKIELYFSCSLAEEKNVSDRIKFSKFLYKC